MKSLGEAAFDAFHEGTEFKWASCPTRRRWHKVGAEVVQNFLEQQNSRRNSAFEAIKAPLPEASSK